MTSLIVTMNFDSREIQIIEMIAEGCNVKEIADKMIEGGSRKKMQKEIDKLRYKMGAKNMAHMVLIAVKGKISEKFLVA